MNDSYLWNRSGEPEPEIERLENLLAEFRWTPAPLRLPESHNVKSPFRWWAAVALATACAALVIVSAWITYEHTAARRSAPQQITATAIESWRVTRRGDRQSTPRASEALGVGQWIETDEASRADLQLSSTGEVSLDPKTRVGLLQSNPGHYRLALAVGTIHALIWAPPREFFVDTPAAEAVDLGCAYTLSVEPSGAGLLRVTSGWVAFHSNGHESFVPKGAMCAMRPGFGPGTPYFGDASPQFQRALRDLDFNRSETKSLQSLLASARKNDALTLWHLLTRVPAESRGKLFDRLAQFVAPPSGVTRSGVIAGDRTMLDRWWETLGFGDAAFWRSWERDWSPDTRPPAPEGKHSGN